MAGVMGKLAGAAARAGTDWFDGGDLPHFHGTGGSSGDLLTTGLCTIQREKGAGEGGEAVAPSYEAKRGE